MCHAIERAARSPVRVLINVFAEDPVVAVGRECDIVLSCQLNAALHNIIWQASVPTQAAAAATAAKEQQSSSSVQQEPEHQHVANLSRPQHTRCAALNPMHPLSASTALVALS